MTQIQGLERENIGIIAEIFGMSQESWTSLDSTLRIITRACDSETIGRFKISFEKFEIENN